jgi:LmbE family N-acetylglucosaminyl deacetylase
MVNSRTLVCVHAHPDDEAIFTSGASSHYGELGDNVVLITCTNGRLGFDHQQRAGNDPGHDDDETRATRAGELARSAALVGFNRVVTLGFEDSGMAGWPQNENPHAFMNIDVDKVAHTLAALFDEVGAAVVLTYDENGYYGHPDHVMANVVTRRALEFAAAPQRLYYPITPRGVIRAFVPRAQAANVFLPAWILEADAGTPDELVATVLDVSRFSGVKQQAIRTHASQLDNADLVTMEPELFSLMFGTEYYQRAWSRGAASGDKTDLFGGL